MKPLVLLLPLLALAPLAAARAATNGVPHEAIERMRSAMTWDAITNAMESLGDELEKIEDGWLFGEAFYKIQNGALPFEPSKAGFEPDWPAKVDFADIFLPGVARSAELERRAEVVADPAFAAAFDRFRRNLVAAVDAGSQERFEALVDPAWRESLRGKGGAPAAFGARFFVAALADRESQCDVPRVLLRPLLPDEATRLLALAPGESNRVDRIFSCLAWMWDNGPRVDFAVVRDGDSFAMAAPPLWRFVPAAIGKVGRADDVTGRPSFETPPTASARFCSARFGPATRPRCSTGSARKRTRPPPAHGSGTMSPSTRKRSPAFRSGSAPASRTRIGKWTTSAIGSIRRSTPENAIGRKDRLPRACIRGCGWRSTPSSRRTASNAPLRRTTASSKRTESSGCSFPASRFPAKRRRPGKSAGSAGRRTVA